MSQTKPISYIYNPDNQSAEELIAGFVVRTSEFQRIFDDIHSSKMTSPEQGYLILGPRGSGKTTLLLRLMHEIEHDKSLSNWLIPVRFSEELYDVRKLERLWKKTIEYLDEREIIPGILDKLEKFESLCYTESYEEDALSILVSSLKASRLKIILFIDNLGDILDKFDERDQKRFREVLITVPEIRIVGASSRNLEHTYDYSKPLYDFFKKMYLGGLTRDETITLLRRLAADHHSDTVEHIIQKEPERIEALRQLAGGVPRTIVLLFEIFSDDQNGSAVGDLEQLLDAETPLYKHRMDDLSPQQQTIVDALAIAWDAMSTKDISGEVRMESKAVSSQLRELEKQGLVHAIETQTKNNLYQITERFFNIWYLMRNGSRREKLRVKWLVRFLETWCSDADLADRAQKHLEALAQKSFSPRYAQYLTEALIGTGRIPYDLGHKLITLTRSMLKGSGEPSLAKQLSASDIEIVNEVNALIEAKQYQRAIKKLEAISYQTGFKELQIGIIYELDLRDYKKAEANYLRAAELKNADSMNNLGLLYVNQFQNYKEAEKYFQMAISHGVKGATNNLGILYANYLFDYEEAKACYLKAIEYGFSDTLSNLALLYAEHDKDYRAAEKYFLLAIDKNVDNAFYNLANLYEDNLQDYNNAEKYYLKAIEKNDLAALNNLALLYENHFQDNEKALKYFLEAIGKGHVRSMFNLALMYERKIQDYEKAEEYYIMAANHGLVDSMVNLGDLYQNRFEDYENAKLYYERAIGEGDARALNNLALLYEIKLQDYQNAEKYYRMAIAKDYIGAMYNLGRVYDYHSHDYEAAAVYYSMAAEKNNELAMNNLAYLYFRLGENKEKALELSRISFSKNTDLVPFPVLILILLWNDKIEEAFQLFLERISLTNTNQEGNLARITDVLIFLMAKRQYHRVVSLFDDEKYTKYEFKARFKPVYYALMYFMKKEYSNEYLKMGEEIRETFQAIIERVERMRVEYA
jgi:TPR repeat protein/DNA-binding transcriptional ArsR family regulator